MGIFYPFLKFGTSSPTPPPPSTNSIHISLLMGQSNAEGGNPGTDGGDMVPDFYTSSQAYNQAWTNAPDTTPNIYNFKPFQIFETSPRREDTNPTGSLYGSHFNVGFSEGLTLSNYYGQTVYLFPNYESGESINLWDRITGSLWLEFTNITGALNNLQATASAQGKTVVVDAITWVQGEADLQVGGATSTQYQGKLESLISASRAIHPLMNNAPFYMFTIGEGASGLANHSQGRITINQQFYNVRYENPSLNRIIDTTANFFQYRDSVHYKINSYISGGILLANDIINPQNTTLSDSNATTFINAVNSAGYSMNTTEQGSTIEYVLNLKAAGIWNSFKGLYPMVGSTSGSKKINMVSPGTHDITFHGGWTFNVTSSIGNGSTSYGDTGINASSSLGQNFHFALYNRSDQGTPIGFDIGCYDGTNYALGGFNGNTGTSDSTFGQPFSNTVQFGGGQNAFWLMNASGSQAYVMENFVTESFVISSSRSMPNFSVYVGAYNSGSAPAGFSSLDIGLYSMGTYLTGTQATAFNAATAKYMQALGKYYFS